MKKRPGPSGTLIVDKPPGMTSHDVVGRVRRALDTRRVGHAGTLDPMATGVLVVMVGEATKLAPFLTANDKRYRAGVELGRSTDTLDAEGETTAEAALPSWWPHDARAHLEPALASERARREQDPPVYSAIKIGGRSAHKRVRAGEHVELPSRPVEVRQLTLLDAFTPEGRFELTLEVSKGYYVRSLARDLGQLLDVPAHLASLRREGSGVFTIAEAVALSDVSEKALITLAEAAQRALGTARLSGPGAVRARCGAVLGDEDFDVAPSGRAPTAWLGPEGELVAVGARDASGRPLVARVFNAPTEAVLAPR